MTKDELLGVPLVGEILRWTGAFPVRRGAGDRDALRLARRLVRDGNVVGVFVEGTRQRDGRPGAAQAGAAMLTIQEQVPIVPCGIDTFRLVAATPQARLCRLGRPDRTGRAPAWESRLPRRDADPAAGDRAALETGRRGNGGRLPGPAARRGPQIGPGVPERRRPDRRSGYPVGVDASLSVSAIDAAWRTATSASPASCSSAVLASAAGACSSA